MKKIAISVILLATLAVTFYLYHKYRIAPSIPFQTLELTDLNGQPVKLQDFKDKKLFLNFFATWCGPCVGEFPALDATAGILAADSFIFISISDEPLPLLNRFSARLNAGHIMLLHSNKKLHDLGVFTVPTNYLLNNTGKVVFEKTGVLDWNNAEVMEDLKKEAE